MPFIEITGDDRVDSVRTQICAGLTTSLAQAFDISPEIVTVYFHTVATRDYGHAGALAPPAAIRNFLKVHAFPRELAMKRRAASSMTEAFVGATGIEPKNVVIYFFDRDPQDVAHGGILACD
jgi:phenylpyruvate tautomerase PptA (4-oxalocrotonate tautomerase family)